MLVFDEYTQTKYLESLHRIAVRVDGVHESFMALESVGPDITYQQSQCLGGRGIRITSLRPV